MGDEWQDNILTNNIVCIYKPIIIQDLSKLQDGKLFISIQLKKIYTSLQHTFLVMILKTKHIGVSCSLGSSGVLINFKTVKRKLV